jgi:hypothetical protein
VGGGKAAGKQRHVTPDRRTQNENVSVFFSENHEKIAFFPQNASK